MQNVFCVQFVEAVQQVDEDFPNFDFGHKRTLFLLFFDFFVQIAFICVFHGNGQDIEFLIKKGVAVANDVRGGETSEESDFIEGVVFLFGAEGFKIDFFQCVDLLVDEATGFVD